MVDQTDTKHGCPRLPSPAGDRISLRSADLGAKSEIVSASRPARLCYPLTARSALPRIRVHRETLRDPKKRPCRQMLAANA